LGISTTAIVLLNNKKGKDKGREVAVEPKDVKSKENNPVKQQRIETADNGQLVVADDHKKNNHLKKETGITIAAKQNTIKPEDKKGHANQVKNEEPVFADNNNEKRPTNNLPQPTIENHYLRAIESEKTLATVAVPKNEPSLTKDKDNTHFAAVTNEVPQPSYAIEQQPSGNKGLRGFFRKITRTIEKRANFNKASDDDDRLLIAGLSIKTN
jgi:hypothetical protein